MTRRQMFLVAATTAITFAAQAFAQVNNELLSAGGDALSNGTVLTIGDLAIGPIGTGVDETSQGAVPCWINAACPGDLDGSGTIDLADLATLLAHFGTTSGAAPEDGDVDLDGDIDLSDLATLMANFGATCT